jgi:hypothetical protein
MGVGKYGSGNETAVMANGTCCLESELCESGRRVVREISDDVY